MRTFLLIACLALLYGCVAPEEPPGNLVTPSPPPPPPPPPPGGGGGGAPGGGGGGAPPIPGVCGDFRSLDPGGHGGFPGSGVGQDGGVGQLWLVRVDRGTANLASSIQQLIQRTTSALGGAKLSPRGIAVLSLYDNGLLWSTSDARVANLNTIASALLFRAQLDNPSPAGCATSQLLNLGSLLSSFLVRPGALLVGVVDHGARPMPLASCGNPGADLAKDPACWATFGGLVLHRADFRFGFFATPESGTTAEMKASCLAVPGFPVEVLDSLEASDASYFDPLAQQMDQAQPGLATRIDLCRALGSDAPAQLAALASAWAVVLAAQP